jgi:hypothetical protein
MAEPTRILPTENGTSADPVLVNEVIWTPDSQHLIVFAAQGLYRVDLATLELAQITEDVKGSWYGGATWIP